MKQEIRIIGGTYRGKKIQFPCVDGLRPTADRVKETLFNWLMHDIHDARCLDVFAGSGSLGIEAFSRGASRVVFVEHSKAAYAQLKKTLSSFSSPKLSVVNTDALLYLEQCKEQYDLIFLDPPFAKNWIPTCLEYIRLNQLLAPEGLIYLESAQAIDLSTGPWKQKKQKKTGHVFYSLLEHQ